MIPEPKLVQLLFTNHLGRPEHPIADGSDPTGRQPQWQPRRLACATAFLIVPFPPGGLADIVGRPFADAPPAPGLFSMTTGVYGTMHMPMEIFAHTADIKLLHVPFTGGGPAVIALLGGPCCSM